MRRDKPVVLGGGPLFQGAVPILRPTLPALEEMAADLRDVLHSGQITNRERVRRLEEAAENALGVPHCVAISSCTSGLLLVFRCLDLRGEVILPSFGFFATAHAVVWNGLTPVFVDCQPDTFNVDPARIEAAITPSTAAIVAVHMYGNPADVKELGDIARGHGLPLIFDAAHAFGSRHGDHPVGGFGRAEVFSLSPTKTVTAGEGGLVTTHDGELARLLRIARNYGDGGDYDPEVLGLNARMSELHAVLGLRSMARVEEEVARRNSIADGYERRLRNLSGLAFQSVRPGNRSTYKDFSFLVDAGLFGLDRDLLCRAIEAENIATRKYFHPPIHRQKLYQGRGRSAGPLAVTEQLSDTVVSLPIYGGLADDDVDRICSAIERIAWHAEAVKQRLGAKS